MDLDESIVTEHQGCAVANMNSDQPCVRILEMWFAANDGFYSSGPNVKAVYRQLTANPKVELCPHRVIRLAKEQGWTLAM